MQLIQNWDYIQKREIETQGQWRSRLPFIIVDPTSKVSAKAVLTKK